MKKVQWKTEPKGPGRAVHMFLDAGEERVELLAYDCPSSHGRPRMCGYEVFGRLRNGGPFHQQLAAGEARSLEEAMAAAQKMISQTRGSWAKLPRSWVDVR
jgi:hypothetical protein